MLLHCAFLFSILIPEVREGKLLRSKQRNSLAHQSKVQNLQTHLFTYFQPHIVFSVLSVMLVICIIVDAEEQVVKSRIVSLLWATLQCKNCTDLRLSPLSHNRIVIAVMCR